MELSVVPPYRLDLTVWALRRRARNQVDRWNGCYRRGLLVDGRPVSLAVQQHGPTAVPVLRVDAYSAGHQLAEASDVEDQVSALLGLDVDLHAFYEVADAHPLSKPLKDRYLGVRPPRFPTIFEALCNAVANQQMSLEVGLTLINRLTEAFGVETPGGDGLRAFPTPEALVEASPDSLRAMGFSARKAEYLQGIASTVAAGTIDLELLVEAGRAEATQHLTAIRGIGRWSAEYVLLRGVGRLDVFPGDDVGARNKLMLFMGLNHPPTYHEIAALLHPWQPWAGMIYFHLLLAGLDQRGELAA